MGFDRIAGHLWTVAPHLLGSLRALVRRDRGEPWSTTVADERFGEVPVVGVLHPVPQARDLLVVIHGLGGSPESVYCSRAVRAGRAAGLTVLVLAARGADLAGYDIGHAGLTDDLHAALSSPLARGHRRIVVLGYSLGGHIALSYATEDRALAAAAAAVCPPIDLAAACAAVDAPRRSLYRGRMLRSLRRLYSEIDARGRAWTPLERVQGVRSIREYDEAVIVPRFGFADADDYYATATVAPRLGSPTIPALLVAGEQDPLVPWSSVRPHLRDDGSGRLVWRAVPRGGHVGFAPGTKLGLGARGGVEAQIVSWLSAS